MKKSFFITGTDTNIGKTVISSILVEKLNATYWKPIQCGKDEKNRTDSQVIKKILKIKADRIYPEKYIFKSPVSPNLASEDEKIKISIKSLNLNFQKSKFPMIVEGAGGVLVPLNKKKLMIDLINHLKLSLILVSSTKIGTINHTLMTLECLKSREINLHGIILVGKKDDRVINTILNFSKKIMGDVKILGTVPYFKKINKKIIKKAGNFINL